LELFQKRLHDRLEKIALDGFESLYLLEQEYQTELGFEYNYEAEFRSRTLCSGLARVYRF